MLTICDSLMKMDLPHPPTRAHLFTSTSLVSHIQSVPEGPQQYRGPTAEYLSSQEGPPPPVSWELTCSSAGGGHHLEHFKIHVHLRTFTNYNILGPCFLVMLSPNSTIEKRRKGERKLRRAKKEKERKDHTWLFKQTALRFQFTGAFWSSLHFVWLYGWCITWGCL